MGQAREAASRYVMICSQGIVVVCTLQQDHWEFFALCSFFLNFECWGIDYIFICVTACYRKHQKSQQKNEARVLPEIFSSCARWPCNSMNVAIHSALASARSVVCKSIFCRAKSALIGKSSPAQLERRRQVPLPSPEQSC